MPWLGWLTRKQREKQILLYTGGLKLDSLLEESGELRNLKVNFGHEINIENILNIATLPNLPLHDTNFVLF